MMAFRGSGYPRQYPGRIPGAPEKAILCLKCHDIHFELDAQVGERGQSTSLFEIHAAYADNGVRSIPWSPPDDDDD